jgi:DNA primase
MDWLDIAKALPIGGSKKVEHECGEGLPLVVFHNENVYGRYCHRCGKLPPVFKELPTLAERAEKAAQSKNADDVVAADRRPPMPAVFDPALWPKEARLWLFKAGLSIPEITSGGFYYHESTRRVVIPVVAHGSLIYWQARRIFGSAAAKYLSMPGGRKNAIPVFGSGRGIVLVEDLLSAFKIQTAGCRSLCLMGTSLLPQLWEFLLHEEEISIWLDPDKAGRSATTEIRDQLALVGKKVRIIETARDPKFQSKADIRQMLCLPFEYGDLGRGAETRASWDAAALQARTDSAYTASQAGKAPALP